MQALINFAAPAHVQAPQANGQAESQPIHAANGRIDEQLTHEANGQASPAVAPQQPAAPQVSQVSADYISLEEAPAVGVTMNGTASPASYTSLSHTVSLPHALTAKLPKTGLGLEKKGTNYSPAATQNSLANLLGKFRQSQLQRGQLSPPLERDHLMQHQPWEENPRDQPQQDQRNQTDTSTEAAPWRQAPTDGGIPGLAIESFGAANAAAKPTTSTTAASFQTAVASALTAQQPAMVQQVQDAISTFLAGLRTATGAGPLPSAEMSGSALDLELSQPPAAHLQMNGAVNGPTTTAAALRPVVAPVSASQPAPVSASPSASGQAAAEPVSDDPAESDLLEMEAGKKRGIPPSEVEHAALHKKARHAAAPSTQLPNLLPFIQNKDASQGAPHCFCSWVQGIMFLS